MPKEAKQSKKELSEADKIGFNQEEAIAMVKELDKPNVVEDIDQIQKDVAILQNKIDTLIGEIKTFKLNFNSMVLHGRIK